MHAYVWSEDGLNLEEVEDPHARPGEVRLRVEACGLCQTDVHVMSGVIPFPTPCVLGHEVAGVVDELGDSVTGLHVGDRVVGGFIMPCARCRQCARGHDDQCELFLSLNRRDGVLYDGESRLMSTARGPVAQYSMGGLAEFCVLPATAVAELPDSLPAGDAAVLGCSGLTAFGAVRNVADLARGESAAVIGVGGVGLNLVQLARLHGADPVIAVDLDAEKLRLASSLGATHTIDAASTDVADAIRGVRGRGVDVCFDVVGAATTIADSIAAVDLGGQVVVVGVGAGTTPVTLDVLDLVRRKVQLKGSFGGRTRTDLPQLVQYAATGALNARALISHRYAFTDAATAVAELRAGRVTGRAVISVP